MGKKIRDDEKLVTLLVCGLFSAAIIFIDFKYALFHSMNHWVLLPVIALHLLLAFTWWMLVQNIYDPNYDKYRYWNIGIAFILIAIIMFHRSDRLGTQEFWKEVNENKIENAAP